MKIRNGFVSNSSSSSFIVAYKGNNFSDSFKEELNDISIPFFGKQFYNDINNCLSRNIVTTINSLTDLIEHENLEYLLSNSDRELFAKKILEGYTIGIGSISDENDYDMIDNWLCHKDLTYDGENVIIRKEGGY